MFLFLPMLLDAPMQAPTQPILVIAPAPEFVPVIEGPPAPPPPPARLPDAVRSLIEAATAGGDAAAVETIMRYARQTNPETIAQIDALDAEFAARQAEKQAAAARARADALASTALLDNWKGEVEAGGSRFTGNNAGFGLYGAVNLTREGLRWRNTLNGRFDYQRTNGETVTERGNAAWQPNYKIGDRLYAYGIAQYEHDRLLGYTDRYTGGAGIGYRVVAGPTLRVDFEGGPALRHTDFVETGAVTRIAARASLGVRWAIAPTLTFVQDGALFVEQGNNNASATTSLDTKLIGALKARLSYNVTYERGALAASDTLDTITRATIAYSF
ncbi:DUF481 domain-containing protein [Sphingomonas solaris]|uniref:DUF481 domain-containing protein n=1 Tax=Alterirhizorhabdus solaris TaxID=2529389 RepID=A0A558RBX3_9SPHN|nr:DUF481 domain-containing protein [Sphingomonas solaris]TVV76853.1 DUF481 domain-containing protein [Sphingomonas solaris]